MRDELFQQWFFLLDFEKLSVDAELLGDWPSLGEELEDRTEWVCGVFGLGIHHMASSEKLQGDEKNTLPIVLLIRATGDHPSAIRPCKAWLCVTQL